MPQHIRPTTQTKLKIVPKDGELEVTLNINITIDGELTTSIEGGVISAQSTKTDGDDDVPTFIPDFTSGKKLDFGKKE